MVLSFFSFFFFAKIVNEFYIHQVFKCNSVLNMPLWTRNLGTRPLTSITSVIRKVIWVITYTERSRQTTQNFILWEQSTSLVDSCVQSGKNTLSNIFIHLLLPQWKPFKSKVNHTSFFSKLIQRFIDRMRTW